MDELRGPCVCMIDVELAPGVASRAFSVGEAAAEIGVWGSDALPSSQDGQLGWAIAPLFESKMKKEDTL